MMSWTLSLWLKMEYYPQEGAFKVHSQMRDEMKHFASFPVELLHDSSRTDG